MFSNFSLIATRSLKSPLILLSRSYNKNSNPASAVKDAARTAGKALSGNYPSDQKPHVQTTQNVANDLGGEPSHPDRSFVYGLKDELRVLKEDVIQEDARRIIAKAKETSENLSNKLGSATGTVTGKVVGAVKAASSKAADSMKGYEAKAVPGKIVGAVKAASSKAADSMQDYEAKGKSSLNDVLDAAEDKFGSFREPRAKQPVNPKIDVLAEEDINDLVDELEDKVRGMDHVKEAISDPKIRAALGIDEAKKPGKRV